MQIQLPGGTAIDSDGSIISAADNGAIALHTPLALSRLIERWKAESHPNLAGLLASYTDQVQTLENAIWDVIVARLPDYAEGAQLDTLGKIVGQDRDSLGDAAYRAHIKARIRINRSFGEATDVIEMLRLITSVRFHFREGAMASFRIDFDAPPETVALAHEIPGLVAQCRAGGVSGIVTMPVSASGGIFASSYIVPSTETRKFGSCYIVGHGGTFAHAAAA